MFHEPICFLQEIMKYTAVLPAEAQSDEEMVKTHGRCRGVMTERLLPYSLYSGCWWALVTNGYPEACILECINWINFCKDCGCHVSVTQAKLFLQHGFMEMLVIWPTCRHTDSLPAYKAAVVLVAEQEYGSDFEMTHIIWQALCSLKVVFRVVISPLVNGVEWCLIWCNKL